jgi:hypothetical protein
VKAGAKGLAALFGLLMDRMARKRPNGLVARFRKRFGRVSENDAAETSEDFTNRIIEKAKKKR